MHISLRILNRQIKLYQSNNVCFKVLLEKQMFKFQLYMASLYLSGFQTSHQNLLYFSKRIPPNKTSSSFLTNCCCPKKVGRSILIPYKGDTICRPPYVCSAIRVTFN